MAIDLQGIGSILTVIVTVGIFAYQKFDNYLIFRRQNYEEWEKFKSRLADIQDDSKPFEKDALLKTVGFLQHFSWQEYEFLMTKSLTLDFLTCLNDLKNSRFTYFDGTNFCIPNKKQAYRSLISWENTIFVIFVSATIILFIQNLFQHDFPMIMIALFSVLLLILMTVFLVYNFHISQYLRIYHFIERNIHTDIVKIDNHFWQNFINQNP